MVTEYTVINEINKQIYSKLVRGITPIKVLLGTVEYNALKEGCRREGFSPDKYNKVCGLLISQSTKPNVIEVY